LLSLPLFSHVIHPIVSKKHFIHLTQIDMPFLAILFG